MFTPPTAWNTSRSRSARSLTRWRCAAAADRIQPVVAHAWRQAFGGRLNEVALADTAVALRDGRPWSEALWTTGR